MLKSARILPLFAAVLLLAGCAASPNAVAGKTPPSTPKPVPTPTPTIMSITEAAALYLSSACTSNVALKTFNAVYTNGSSELPSIQAVAATARDAVAATATTLDKGLWPDEVKADIATVRDADFGRSSALGSIVGATSAQAAFATSFPNEDAAASASQRVRSRLGLSPDGMAGC